MADGWRDVGAGDRGAGVTGDGWPGDLDGDDDAQFAADVHGDGEPEPRPAAAHAHPSAAATERPTPMFPLPAGDAPIDLLVWDAPNIDATLAQVIGAKPTAASRPRYDAIARWLVQLGDDGHEVEGAVFANVPPVNAGQMRGWVEAVRSLGFAVFARPKLADRDDVDLDMLEHVHHRARSGRLARLVVASGDGRNFLAPLEALAQDGVEVTVLSFFEVAGYAAQSPHLRFLDLEEVPGAFQHPLDRTRLDSLPPDGAWLRPTRSLREVAGGS
ncbi:NYN domain-containing protein [Aquipuribacter hungaricus]|uniref:NYN domain-containing protein n=1 Tax=Aquipuribacter hungaricus TaxID=545624 RepID=A0ABV7WLA2_9MICO